MDTKKRNSLIAAALVVAAGGSVLVTKLRASRPVEVHAVSVETKRDFVLFADGEGQILPAQEWFVTAIRGGRLERVEAKVGDMVHAGQVLGVIEEQQRTARLKSALTTYRATANDVSRLRHLVASGAATQQELDDTTTRYLQQKSELEQAKASLEDGVLRATASGRLTSIAFARNDFVPDGSRVFVLENDEQTVLNFKIPYEFKRRLPDTGDVYLSDGVETLSTDATASTGSEPRPGEHRLSGAFQVLNKESDFDGLFVEVRMVLPKNDLPKNKILHVRVPIKRYETATIVDRKALTTKDGKTSIVVFDPASQGVKVLEVKVTDRIGDKVVLAVPNAGEVKIIDPEPQKLDRILTKKLKVSVKDSPRTL